MTTDFNSTVYFTSQLYPLNITDQMVPSVAMKQSAAYTMYDSIVSSPSFIAGELLLGLTSYENWIPENLIVATGFTGGSLNEGLASYAGYLPESLSVETSVLCGFLVTGLQTYSRYVPENLTVSARFTSGTLS